MITKRLAAIVALGLAVTAGAQASEKLAAPKTVLSTPPLIPEGKSQLDCYIINVSDKVRDVLIEALDRDGHVVADWTEALEPSKEAVAIATSDLKPRSCRFIVDGQARHFRASGLVHLPGFGSISALAAQ